MRVREAKEQFQDFYSRSGCPNHENEWVDESEKSIHCRIAFHQWAVQNGLEFVAGKQSLRLDDFREGGREHLIYPQGGKAYKSTNGGFYGYAVELGGEPKLYPCQDPVRYLDRFVSVEEIWGLTTDFVGVVGEESRFAIIIRQDWVAGRPASEEEIRVHMKDLGFRELPRSVGYKRSLSFFNQSFAVFDLRPANVVKMEEDELVVPIDCFVERLDDEGFQALEEIEAGHG